MYSPRGESSLAYIEQKSALQILAKLLEMEKNSCATRILFNSVDVGSTAFYKAIGMLLDGGLISSYQEKQGKPRILSLTEFGKEVAYKVVDIEKILDKKLPKNKENMKHY